VSLGFYHSLAILRNGTLLVWGSNQVYILKPSLIRNNLFPYDHRRGALGIVLLYGPRGGGVLMGEVPLYTPISDFFFFFIAIKPRVQ